MSRVIFLKKDDTGLLPDNYIQDENLVTSSGSNRLVIPEYGAFFEDNFQMKDAITNAVVSPDDYYFADLYQEASQATGKAVWNLVILKNAAINNEVKISYRAYGGPFSRNARKLIDWLREKEQDFLHPASWSEVIDIPKKFTPAFHNHLLRDIFGGEYFEEGLRRIENSITAGNSHIVQSINNEVIEKLQETRATALELSKAIIETSTNSVLNKVNKKFLGLDLVANLGIATYDDMQRAANTNVSASMIAFDKYIDKKRLKIYSDLIKKSVVSSKDTNLGLTTMDLTAPTKANLIATVNGAVITLDSMENHRKNKVSFDLVVYPKGYPEEDEFTVIRVTNNIKEHSGVWLGFNASKLTAYVGIMVGDECFRRMRWYRFYTDGSITEIESKVQEHIRDTKNPHELTKEHVELEAVENYPVVTEAQILAQESTKSYVTMDTLMYFMAAHILNLKANPNEDGSVDLSADLFDKANIIYTPCDKTPAPVCPPKGQFIKDYCVGTEKMGRWTDGACGFYDEVMESNSDDCDYFEMPKQGTVLNLFCEGYDQMAKISDGRGATYVAMHQEKSSACGWNPPALGTLISTRCEGYNTITKYADGLNGNYEVNTSINDPKCGYIEQTVEGVILAVFCNGANMVTRYSDGKGSSFEVISSVNDPKCNGTGQQPVTYPPQWGPPPYITPPPPYVPPSTGTGGNSPPGNNTPPYVPPPSGGGNATPPPYNPQPGGGSPSTPTSTNLTIFSDITTATVGTRERLTVKVANYQPYTSYQVNIYSYATINKEGIQSLLSQSFVTDAKGSFTLIHEYAVTDNIFTVSGATTNITQLSVKTYARTSDAMGLMSNEVSKQVSKVNATRPPPSTNSPPYTPSPSSGPTRPPPTTPASSNPALPSSGTAFVPMPAVGYPKGGTVLGTYCLDGLKRFMTLSADGQGGVNVTPTRDNDPRCSASYPPHGHTYPPNTNLFEVCENGDLKKYYIKPDGKTGILVTAGAAICQIRAPLPTTPPFNPIISQPLVPMPSSGFIAKGTYLGSYCTGVRIEAKMYASGNNSYTETTDSNSSNCNGRYQPNVVIAEFCNSNKHMSVKSTSTGTYSFVHIEGSTKCVAK